MTDNLDRVAGHALRGEPIDPNVSWLTTMASDADSFEKAREETRTMGILAVLAFIAGTGLGLLIGSLT